MVPGPDSSDSCLVIQIANARPPTGGAATGIREQEHVMLTDRTITTDRLALDDHPTRGARRTLMRVNGVFLAVVGSVQVAFELMGYYAGAGPFGRFFHHSPLVAGWVENHGFAVLVGLLFLVVAARDGRPFWHVFALAVHALLATANLTFWSGYAAFNAVPAGIASTIAHFVFIAGHFIALVSYRRGARTPAAEQDRNR
jgi:hypothetical protein